jgi:RND family efflux transporter MFP subunit
MSNLARRAFGILFVLFSLVLAAIGTGCNKTPVGQASQQLAEEKHLSVTTVKPEKKTMRRVIKQPGTVEAFQETPVYARIPGYVGEVVHDMGDRVRGPRVSLPALLMYVGTANASFGIPVTANLIEPGDIMADLSVPEMVEELRLKQALVFQAQAEEEQARASVESAESNIESQKALVKEAEAGRMRAQATYERWESEHKRFTSLLQQNVSDQQTLDEMLKQVKAADAARQEVEAKIISAKAQEKESESKRNKARADLKAAGAHVKAAEAEAGRLAALVEFSHIRAPFDGVITQRNVITGHFVQPATGTGSRPLFVVAQADVVRVFSKIPEPEAPFIKDGMKATIQTMVVKDRDFEGKVTRTSWSLNQSERNLTVEVDLSNKEGKLRPGMYTYVTFVAMLADRFTLPLTAVAGQGDQTHCFLVENGKLVRTPVRLGVQDGTVVEMIAKQVKPAAQGEEPRWEYFDGSEVVVQGKLSGLTDGQSVEIAKEKKP